MLTIAQFVRRTAVVSVYLFALLLWHHSIAWSNEESQCKPPASLARQIGERFAGYTIVGIKAMRPGDRSRFRAEHPNSCPGLVKLDFYGTGMPTYGVALTKRQRKQVLLKVVVATRTEKTNGWNLRELDEATNLVAPPAIWAEPPGEYKDVREKKIIRATHPVLLAAQYEAWAIAFSWDGTQIQKVWITD
jgi:hypothetical protein